MKRYTKPEMSITTLKNTESVLLVSGGITLKSALDGKKYNEIGSF